MTDRFWAKAAKTDGCWEWTGYRNRQGYGRFRVEGKSVLAHRMAYELAHGAIPDGSFVCHRCDNPKCVRPDHLFLGTHKENMADMVAKGRQGARPQVRGEDHSWSKLSNESVRQVFALRALGISQSWIATRFGVTQAAISKVQSRARCAS